MGETILPGKPPISVTLRHSPRARRIALRVSGLDGRVTLSLPPGVREAEGMRFAREREGWLRAVLAAQPAVEAVVPGIVLPVDGEPRTLVLGAGPAFEAGVLRVRGPIPRAGVQAEAVLRVLARERLAAAVARYAAALGRPPSALVLRDARSRWGSCSSEGRLMFSWRLILAPPAVLDYVAAHEVAHLGEMNHGPRFWRLVTRLCPGYDEPRAWLRREGSALHRWRFRC